MYETKIIVPSRKGRGLVGLGVGATQGPSFVDRVSRFFIAFLVMVLILTVVEPFLGAASVSSSEKLEQDFERLSNALAAYEKDHGPYTASNPAALADGYIDEIPLDPWGGEYLLDVFWKRIISKGENKVLETGISPSDEGGDAQGRQAGDDRIFSYRRQGTIWLTRKVGAGRELIYARAGFVDFTRFETSVGADLRDPAVSPDGERLALCVAKRPDEYDIVICRRDGSDPKVLTDGGNNVCPTWSSDGANLVYQGKRCLDGDVTYRLYYYNTVLRRETLLTGGPGRHLMPSCHPSEPSRLVAVSTVSDHTPKIHLYDLTAENGAPRKIATGGGKEKGPRWSADGHWIVFVAKTLSGTEIHRYDVQSKETARLTSLAGHYMAVDTSPFDNRVVAILRENGKSVVLVIDPETDTRRLLYSTDDRLVSVRWTL